MTAKPSYVVHTVTEKEITVDWFFGKGHLGKKVKQGLLLIVAWFFAILPVVVTASAILNRDNPNKGWWKYAEGFALWDMTIAFLAIFGVLFVVGYFLLFLLNRASEKSRNAVATFDQERLAKRLEIAEHLYAEKFGPPAMREQQRSVKIQPYADIETFELRGLYREYGVE